ncbi:MAG TPA: tyrosine-protein phosphatase [Candidatus Eisenbacteria bacterium]|nr:tyrosine-protein phosphatase [Candidatus Eisenbacteria bacterium]
MARVTAVALVAAAFALSGPVAAPRADARILDRLTTSSGRPFAISKPEVPGIPNFAEIEPGLARGGRPTAAGIEYLRAQGYRTVVTFLDDAGEWEALKRAGIECVSIPLRAGPFSAAIPTPEERRRFLEVVSDSSRRPLFFHCKRGKDRTGAMAALLRIERDGWTAAEAVQEMRAFGFSGHYKGLLRFVRGHRRGAGTTTPTSPS